MEQLFNFFVSQGLPAEAARDATRSMLLRLYPPQDPAADRVMRATERPGTESGQPFTLRTDASSQALPPLHPSSGRTRPGDDLGITPEMRQALISSLLKYHPAPTGPAGYVTTYQSGRDDNGWLRSK